MTDVAYNIVYMVTYLLRLPLVAVWFTAHAICSLSGYLAGVLSEIPNLYKERGE